MVELHFRIAAIHDAFSSFPPALCSVTSVVLLQFVWTDLISTVVFSPVIGVWVRKETV
jgi:hypothetical protein